MNTHVYIVDYDTDTTEGSGKRLTVAATLSLEDAKRIGEKLPKVMGVAPSATIKQYNLLTFDEFMKTHNNTSYTRIYKLDSDGIWEIFS